MLDFLKTMPDMTNTPEITMQEPKTPMSKQIRDYKAANPDANAKQIAEAVGTTAVYVYQILAVPAKKTDPAKSTSKAASANTVSVKEHEELKKRLANSVEVNIGLEEEIVGLRAVIKYLEEKLEETF